MLRYLRELWARRVKPEHYEWHRTTSHPYWFLGDAEIALRRRSPDGTRWEYKREPMTEQEWLEHQW